MPVTIPSRAHMICTAAIKGNENRAVHKDAYPNAAPVTEYVEMPDGSSSAAPVISPGPRSEKNLRNLPRRTRARRATLSAGFFLLMCSYGRNRFYITGSSPRGPPTTGNIMKVNGKKRVGV